MEFSRKWRLRHISRGKKVRKEKNREHERLPKKTHLGEERTWKP